MDEPQSLSVEHAECLTLWFQYLTTNCKNIFSIKSLFFLKVCFFLFLVPKLPSLTSCTHTLTNRILLIHVIESFKKWLDESRFTTYKPESLHGTVFRCNQERTLYLPVPSLDQMVTKKQNSL